MDTKIIKIHSNNINFEQLSIAARKLSEGGLVVFPTETVYGLGANCERPESVKAIFAAKGRPADNPLIVHVSSTKMAERYVKDPEVLKNKNVKALTNSFWPGPLTIIFHKSENVPNAVSAGLDTVGIRMPENVVARELIRLAGVGVAAPSANISGKPSPTQASHVIDDLMGKVDIIIDSGSCRVGLESTVLDMTGEKPVILRPGGVTKEQIEGVLDTEVLCASDLVSNNSNEMNLDKDEGFVPRAPGMKYKHYAPNAEVFIFQGELSNVTKGINKHVQEAIEKGLTPGILATEQTLCYYKNVKVISLGDRGKPSEIGANLFKSLRDFDDMNVDVIFAEAVDGSGVGAAIMNRLTKAAAYKVILV